MKQTAYPVVRRELNDVLYCVAEHCGVSASEILSRSRSRAIDDARLMFYALCRDVTSVSFAEIGRHLGRDYSGVVDCVHRFARRLAKDRLLARSFAVCRAHCVATLASRHAP
jgi:chromosomal replication initiation ATPase DnaA